MTKKEISAGVIHKLPADLRKTLISSPIVLAAWEDITPLARNEWICWIESVKKPRTRKIHIERTRRELIGGMPACRDARHRGAGRRRPCCWGGCIHRKK